MSWFVPIDDNSHYDTRVHYIEGGDEESRQRHLERQAARENYTDESYDPAKMAQVVLAGKMHISEFFDKEDTLIEDDVAQIGQGLIADRSNERLGRSDANVIMMRKLWERELRALAEGNPSSIGSGPRRPCPGTMAACGGIRRPAQQGAADPEGRGGEQKGEEAMAGVTGGKVDRSVDGSAAFPPCL